MTLPAKPVSQEPLAIDSAALMTSIAKNNKRFRLWAAVSLMLLAVSLFIGAVELYQGNNSIRLQNSIASQNKQHIDCIVKLLATPYPPNTTHKFISDASQKCNINFN